MEVCPYCMKPFKRLKSHLPYCKLGPSDHKVCQSKPAEPTHAKKKKIKVLKKKATELGTETGERNAKFLRHKPEGATKPFPLRDVGLGNTSARKTDKDIKSQVQLSFKMLENAEQTLASQRETRAQFYLSENTTERAPAKDVPKLGEGSCSTTEVPLCPGPLDPSSANQDRKYCSSLPHNVQTTSATPRLHRVNPPGKKRLVNLLAMPVVSGSSPTVDNYETESLRASSFSKEREPKATGHLSEISADVRASATQENVEAQILGLKVHPLGKIQDPEKQGARGSRGSEVKSMSLAEMQEWISTRSDSNLSTPGSAMEKNSREEGPNLNVFVPRETACNEFLSESRSWNQSLVSLAVKCLQEEKTEGHGGRRGPDVRALVTSEEQPFLEARPGSWSPASHPRCQQSVHSPQLPTHSYPFTAQVDEVANRKALRSSLGLEWFPELYPAYLRLGLSPGKAQFWSEVTWKPQLIGPQGSSLSQGKHAHVQAPPAASKALSALSSRKVRNAVIFGLLAYLNLRLLVPWT